eukprot:GHVP01020055.1.p1 GENE.GHVP01020055.1~~GHVP01020055.1.p1  ORF type:complete len:102 (+),score=23.30 GHVP01020055.1:2-307(+)
MNWDEVTVVKKKKPSEGSNKNPVMKHDEETDNPGKPKSVGTANGKIIREGREKKQMTQTQLASKINMTSSVIMEHEKGTAIWNDKLIKKIEKELGMKLKPL